MPAKLTHGLFGRAIVIVEFTAQQAQPVLQLQNTVVHVVARAGLDEQDLLPWKILRQPASNHTAGGATANNDIVEAVGICRGNVSDWAGHFKQVYRRIWVGKGKH